jgi:predicted DNA-binding protein YlxM (UPF0122 family)
MPNPTLEFFEGLPQTEQLTILQTFLFALKDTNIETIAEDLDISDDTLYNLREAVNTFMENTNE